MGQLARRVQHTNAELIAAVDEYQPLLVVKRDDLAFIAYGKFGVRDAHDEVLDNFDVKISIPFSFPKTEPVVFETKGRIPRNPDRHVNGNGSICFGIWEEWLISNDDWSVAGFFERCLRPYFLGQLYFENWGRWPGEERAHYGEGLLEAARRAIGKHARKTEAVRTLKCLGKKTPPRGHWLCPCGSYRKIRYCCVERLWGTYDSTKRLAFANLADRLDQV